MDAGPLPAKQLVVRSGPANGVQKYRRVVPVQPGKRWTSEHLVGPMLSQLMQVFLDHPDYDPSGQNPPSIKIAYPMQGEYESGPAGEERETTRHQSKTGYTIRPEEDYSPMRDIAKTMFTMISEYLPAEVKHLIPSDHPWDYTYPLPQSPSGQQDCLRALQAAIESHDWPAFQLNITSLSASFFAHVNRVGLKTITDQWKVRGIPKPLVLRIYHEAYDRVIVPGLNDLQRCTAFSAQVYGEICPPLVYQICGSARLTKESLVVDLGSGVGNVVVMASLMSGCFAFGVELEYPRHQLAQRLIQTARARCKMWGVDVGPMEIEYNDMLESARVKELLPRADLVFVNNKLFESLNSQLLPHFLGLKEGARVISTVPFTPNLTCGRPTKAVSPADSVMNTSNANAVFPFTMTEAECSSGTYGDIYPWSASEVPYYCTISTNSSAHVTCHRKSSF
ncbi:histone methylation protein DOT1-domain-containing protein [Mycena sp. CBHHK59/15]|nr:histone methylation protein DOT1-domain-containing protein [Mycena sp. CBHHK59/15]